MFFTDLTRNFVAYWLLRVIFTADSLMSASAQYVNESSSPSLESPYTVKLPNSVTPLKYVLKIRPVLEYGSPFVAGTAPGSVAITFKVLNQTDTISLHAHQLLINTSSVTIKSMKDGSEIRVTEQEVNMSLQRFIVKTRQDLMAGENYEVFISFVADITAKQTGLYGFAYPDFWEKGPPVMTVAITRLDPYHAREMFPCFDDLDFKTVFDVSVARLQNYQSFSNAKLKTTTECKIKGWVWDHFESTPAIPVNLLSIVVVPDCVEDQANSTMLPGVKVKVWAPKKFVQRRGTQYATELTARFINFFQDYLKFPFPTPKLDSILTWKPYGEAIGHPGSITYSLVGGSILYFPDRSPEWKRLTVVSLLAKQIAQQWMGNLVYPKNWSEVWFFEGLSQHLGSLALSQLVPEFEPSSTFLNFNNQEAFVIDQSSAPPLVRGNFHLKVTEGGEVQAGFSETAYPKSAALVRMLQKIVSESKFHDGVRNFIKSLYEISFQTASEADFLEAINDVAKDLPTTVANILKSWTTQKGYPVVRVKPSGESMVHVTQEPLKFSGSDGSIWYIPMRITTARKADASLHWLSEPQRTLPVDTTEWFILNTDGEGYFRVLYNSENFQKIKLQLDQDHTVFISLTRSQLLDDYFTFAEHGYVAWEQALELTTYLGKELDLTVWSTMFSHLKHPVLMFTSDAAEHGFKNYLLSKLDTLLGLPEIRPEVGSRRKGAVALLQSELFRHACAFGSKICTKFSLEAIAAWMKAPDANPVPPDLQPIVYCAAVASGDKSASEFIQKMFDATRWSEQHAYLAKARTCTEDAGKLQKLLDESWKSSGPHQALETMEALTENRVGRMLVLKSLEDNWRRIGPTDFANILGELAVHFVPQEAIEKLESFVNSKMNYFEMAKEDLNYIMLKLRSNIRSMQTARKRIDTWCAGRH